MNNFMRYIKSTNDITSGSRQNNASVWTNTIFFGIRSFDLKKINKTKYIRNKKFKNYKKKRVIWNKMYLKGNMIFSFI